MQWTLPPPAAKRSSSGSKTSIEGTRERAGVHGRPMVGTIIKPSIGLSAGETAALVDTLCAADIDFIRTTN
jgi:ribulose-bisphosphate carboxylase large chain